MFRLVKWYEATNKVDVLKTSMDRDEIVKEWKECDRLGLEMQIQIGESWYEIKPTCQYKVVRYPMKNGKKFKLEEKHYNIPSRDLNLNFYGSKEEHTRSFRALVGYIQTVEKDKKLAISIARYIVDVHGIELNHDYDKYASRI